MIQSVVKVNESLCATVENIAEYTYLVIDEGNLFGDALYHKFKLKFEILASEYRVIILLYIGRSTFSFRVSHGR